LEARYVNRLADSLRARGETSLAEAEARRITTSNKIRRADLSVQQARDTLLRSFAAQTLPEQAKAYNTLLATSGRGGAWGFLTRW
jgi:hypothetical protein